MDAFNYLPVSTLAVVVLVRRAIQGVIRDYYNVCRKTLREEIAVRSHTSGVAPIVIDALHGVRNIGNLGAHPEELVEDEKDLTQEDAADMLRALTVVLSLTYVKSYEETERLKRAAELAAEIKARPIS